VLVSPDTVEKGVWIVACNSKRARPAGVCRSGGSGFCVVGKWAGREEAGRVSGIVGILIILSG